MMKKLKGISFKTIFKSHASDVPLPPYADAVTPLRRRRYSSAFRLSNSGQAATEVLLLVPLFILMIGIGLSVGYLCWQGIKVQEAANFAARVQGQERVGGGFSSTSISTDNGLIGVEDKLPSPGQLKAWKNDANAMSGLQAGSSPGGVYGKYRALVRDFFSSGERGNLFVPAPTLGINSDRVRVARVIRPPKILNFQMQPIMIQADAYGGEDSRMYGLPRWGSTGNNGSAFYKSQITKE